MNKFNDKINLDMNSTLLNSIANDKLDVTLSLNNEHVNLTNSEILSTTSSLIETSFQNLQTSLNLDTNLNLELTKNEALTLNMVEKSHNLESPTFSAGNELLPNVQHNLIQEIIESPTELSIRSPFNLEN